MSLSFRLKSGNTPDPDYFPSDPLLSVLSLAVSVTAHSQKMALDSFHQWIYGAQNLVCIVELQIWATYDNRIILLYSKRADTHATVCHLRPARCKIARGCGCLIDLGFFYSAALARHRECVGMYHHSDPNTLFLLTGAAK